MRTQISHIRYLSFLLGRKKRNVLISRRVNMEDLTQIGWEPFFTSLNVTQKLIEKLVNQIEKYKENKVLIQRIGRNVRQLHAHLKNIQKVLM